METSAKLDTNVANLLAAISATLGSAQQTPIDPEMDTLNLDRTWKEYSGRTRGPESYQFGDAIILPLMRLLGFGWG